MGFVPKSDQQDQNNNVTRGNFEKAAAFLNVSVEMGGGKTKQIGGIALKVSNEFHKALMEHGDLDDLILTCELNVVEEQTADDFVFAKREAQA